MKKVKMTAVVHSQTTLADGICSMWIDAKQVAELAAPGQFISVYTKDDSRLLPRPISICEVDREAEKIRIVYRVAGCGTREFSSYQPGDEIEIIGPLGHGYPMEEMNGKNVFIMGGGIGIPPMLELAKQLQGTKQIILGYRDTLFLNEQFETFGTVTIATEDGSYGTRGNVLDAVRAEGLTADVICACGPMPMLRAIKAYAAEHHMECYISLEEKMACGIGACLACVCNTKDKDEHSQVNNKRICAEGPVFRAEEVEI